METERAFEDAYDQLMVWRWEVRPFLWVNQCEYYRALVLEAIRTYERAFDFGIKNDPELLDELYQLLEEDPPPYPSNFDPALRGVLFLLHKS